MRRDIVPLLTLAIGFIMAMIDVTAVNVALPDIARSLTVPLSGLVWVVDAYTLMFAALLFARGALADRFGARIAYVAGLVVFILGSVLCGAARTEQALIAARLIQGASAAMFMPSSLSLITIQYEDSRTRARMIGIWAAMVGLGATMGPLVGGVLTHMFGWRSVFWVNIPVGILGLYLIQQHGPKTHGLKIPLALKGHSLSVIGLGSLSFVLIEGPTRGWSAPRILMAGMAAVVSVLAIIRLERRGAHPIVPRELLGT